MDKNLKIIFRFFILIIVQLAILNKIDFGGYINPQLYILYVISFPYYGKNKSIFMISSFFLGLILDFYMNSGGIYAFSTTLIAYLRYDIYSAIIGRFEESKPRVAFEEVPFVKSFVYLFIMTFIHHTSMCWLENFSFNQLDTMFIKIFSSTLYTTAMLILVLSIFTRSKKIS